MAYLARDRTLAEELTQETFACAWENIARYKGRSSLATWLHKIAYHKFIDSRRRLRRDSALKAGLMRDSSRAPENSDPLQKLTADENFRFLYEAMQGLKSSEYVVIVLHYIQGLSLSEVARVLNRPTGTVKWQTSRALKKLKTHLAGRVSS